MSKKRAKKKEEAGFDPATTKEEFNPEAPEAIEAAEKFEEEQQAHMADLDFDVPEQKPEAKKAEPAEKPPEKPADKEQQSQPGKAEEPELDKQAKAEDQPPGEEPKLKADDPDSQAKPPEEKPADKEEPKEAEFVAGDRFTNFQVEVVTDEGAKSVPLGNLVTTYQQFGHLQRKYQEVKPLFDLVEKAGYKPVDTLPLVELGIQAYLKQQGIVDGSQPPVGATRPVVPQAPSGYQGPFENQEQDDYYKEVDADMHATMHRMYQMASGGGKVAQLEQEISNLKQMRSAPPAADPADAERVNQEAQKAFDDKILTWSGDHTDYFTAAHIGETRLNGFKNFILRSHAQAGLKIKDLSPDFLSAEFARFDPRYNLEYMQKLAGKKAADGKSESGMFAEGTGVRGAAEPLDEQQKHMADM